MRVTLSDAPTATNGTPVPPLPDEYHGSPQSFICGITDIRGATIKRLEGNTLASCALPKALTLYIPNGVVGLAVLRNLNILPALAFFTISFLSLPHNIIINTIITATY